MRGFVLSLSSSPLDPSFLMATSSVTSSSLRGVGRVGRLLPGRPRLPPEDHQPRGDVLVYRVAHDLVLALQVVDAVLLVRELAAALGAHKGVVLPALVLQVPVQVIIPVVGALKI